MPAAAPVRQTGPADQAAVSARTALRTIGKVAPTAAAVVSHPAPGAASIAGIGGVLNQFLTNTANWLAELPGGPISDLLQGVVYLVRRTLFPTSVGVITQPIVVPVYPTAVSDAKKLGIYITLGSDATPALFELDTGGPGIYGAYASNNPLNSDWWGGGAVTTATTVQVVYDSGNTYKGYLANTQVSLYSKDGTTPLLSTPRVDVGQMDTITNGQTQLWTPDGLPPGVSKPPIDGVFYGDFGLAQQYAPNGITNVLAQLTYADGVKPGYRIHIDPTTNTAWLQIGLTNADLQDSAGYYYPEVIDPLAPSGAANPYSGLLYYSKQVFQANIKISDPSAVVLNSFAVGMTADTGSPTILHNTNLSPLPLPTQYAGITRNGYLDEGLNVTVTGTTTAGTQGQVYSFTTKAGSEFPANGVVGVQNNKPGNDVYYLNTGIYLFYVNDVVYDLGGRKGGGVIGLIPNG